MSGSLGLRSVLALGLLWLWGCASTPQAPPVSDGINPVTRARVGAWRTLIEQGAGWPEMKKLNSVNYFVNEVKFVDDIDHWRQPDYWATPLETLVTNGGDCEDISIAKYFTLSAMGVDENKMRLTYVNALEINRPHMVVSYFARPDSEPLILDNLNPTILPGSQRQDLLPVYSFNGSGLWLAKRESDGQSAGGSARLSLWQGVLSQMDAEAADESTMICRYQYYDLPNSKAKTLCP
ncbi:MAG: transglutaminase-like cysteine peptidase [Gammaproteobacteria bacterium]|nr:transglutaminase-like cysteine peptidase [Gammaproteobacteria bacterium]